MLSSVTWCFRTMPTDEEKVHWAHVLWRRESPTGWCTCVAVSARAPMVSPLPRRPHFRSWTCTSREIDWLRPHTLSWSCLIAQSVHVQYHVFKAPMLSPIRCTWLSGVFNLWSYVGTKCLGLIKLEFSVDRSRWGLNYAFFSLLLWVHNKAKTCHR